MPRTRHFLGPHRSFVCLSATMITRPRATEPISGVGETRSGLRADDWIRRYRPPWRRPFALSYLSDDRDGPTKLDVRRFVEHGQRCGEIAEYLVRDFFCLVQDVRQFQTQSLEELAEHIFARDVPLGRRSVLRPGKNLEDCGLVNAAQLFELRLLHATKFQDELGGRSRIQLLPFSTPACVHPAVQRKPHDLLRQVIQQEYY